MCNLRISRVLALQLTLRFGEREIHHSNDEHEPKRSDIFSLQCEGDVHAGVEEVKLPPNCSHGDGVGVLPQDTMD